MTHRFAAAVLMLGLASSAFAQTDLDALMERVLARRDENWKKLQQYVLDERETLRVVSASGAPVYGFERDYVWYARDGVFIRGPVRANGVELPDGARRRAEAEWLEHEQRREAWQQELEPRFVSHAYFLKFAFDPGRYALVSRERLDGRSVLRVEYYPTKLFTAGRSRPNRRLRGRDEDLEAKMNKASLVTLWIDPGDQQILQYAFESADGNFLPGHSLVRIEGVEATMKMAQPFAGVWLPHTVAMTFAMRTATGVVNARYDVEYHDYRLAEVTLKVR